MYTKILDWKIFEAKTKKMGEYDLVIVDVQEPFKKFFGDAYLEALEDYCEDFSRVFQIYDINDIDEPDYLFPNQTLTITKEYGGELNEEDVEYYFTEPMRESIYQKFETGFQERDMFETINGDYFIYVDGAHEWFICTREMADLFKGFKTNGRKIILVGGAANECLKDIYVTMRAFDVNVEYNAQYVYSSKGSQYQKPVLERIEIDNIINASIGTKLPESDIYQYVQNIHSDYDGGFVDGNLGERIEEYNYYTLKDVSISHIDLDEFYIDDSIVDEYEEQFKHSNTYPPIVLGHDFSIIDGTHRSNALAQAGVTTIKAWVGSYE